MSYHLFGVLQGGEVHRQLGEVATSNTEAVRGLVVEPGWSKPWLITALSAPGISSVDADRLPASVRSRLVATGAEVDRCAWGGGSGLEQYHGKVYVKWKPPRAENAVTYANQVKRVFEGVAENFAAGVRIVFSYYDFDFPWYMVGPRGVRVFPEGGLVASVPGDALPPVNQSGIDFTTPLPWAIGGAALGGIILGTGIYLSVRHAKKTRSR